MQREIRRLHVAVRAVALEPRRSVSLRAHHAQRRVLVVPRRRNRYQLALAGPEAVAQHAVHVRVLVAMQLVNQGQRRDSTVHRVHVRGQNPNRAAQPLVGHDPLRHLEPFPKFGRAADEALDLAQHDARLLPDGRRDDAIRVRCRQEVEQRQRPQQRRLAVLLRNHDQARPDPAEVVPQHQLLERLHHHRAALVDGQHLAAKRHEGV